MMPEIPPFGKPIKKRRSDMMRVDPEFNKLANQFKEEFGIPKVVFTQRMAEIAQGTLEEMINEKKEESKKKESRFFD